MWLLLALLAVGYSATAQDHLHSPECLAASALCENDTDCVHRLAVLQAACSTNTCQPQCRIAVLNLYQNRLGRSLLKTDASCLPGRHELRLCGLLPAVTPMHCNLAKLVCEADLQCNSKWEVFVAECETEASQGQCSSRCARLLLETQSTSAGASFANCSCTTRSDQLCDNLRDFVLKACQPPVELLAPVETHKSVDESELPAQRGSPLTGAPTALAAAALCLILVL